MNPELSRYLAEHDQSVSVAEAEAIGISRHQVSAAARRKELTQIARGLYLSTEQLTAGTAEQGHRLRVRALLQSRPDIGASHLSAALLWGLPLQRTRLDRLHVSRRSGTGKTHRRAHYTIHGATPGDAFTRSEGEWLVKPEVAVVQSAHLLSHEYAVAMMDSARRSGVRKEYIEGWCHRFRGIPGVSRARAALQCSDGLAESVGESMLRLILIDLGFSVIAQHRLADEGGIFARADFLLPDLSVVVEFDGLVKYGSNDGEADVEALVREKTREDRIRALGYAVVRVVWADLAKPALIEHRIRKVTPAAHGPAQAASLP